MYLGVCFRRAWLDTSRFLKERLIFQALMLLAGALFGLLVGDHPSKLLSPVVYAVGAVFITAVVVFCSNFLFAPARIYADNQREIDLLREQLKPCLRIYFNEDDDTFFYESQWFHELEDLFDNRTGRKALKYWRIFRIAVKNDSKAVSVENVEVKLTSIEPLPKELKGKLPLSLHFMNDNVQPYKQSKNINVNSTEFIDVISWSWDREMKSPTFSIYHTVNGVDAQFAVGDYRIVIEVSGKNATCEPKVFYIGMRNKDGKANKLWMSETPIS